MARTFGLPSMVSDTYYQLETRRKNLGWIFTAVLWLVSLTMLMCLLDTGKGIQAFAFLGCAGLAFVGAAPRFRQQEERGVHRTGAAIAALGGIAWSLTACWYVTVIIAIQYILYLLRCHYRKDMTHIGYWAEVSAFLDVYITYWLFPAC